MLDILMKIWEDYAIFLHEFRKFSMGVLKGLFGFLWLVFLKDDTNIASTGFIKLINKSPFPQVE